MKRESDPIDCKNADDMSDDMLHASRPELTPSHIKNARYLRAWEDAPEDFKRAASKLGLTASIDPDSTAIEYDENRMSASYMIDPADAIDTKIDQLIERHGVQHEAVIRDVIHEMTKDRKIEEGRARSLAIARIASFLVKGQERSILARIHQLLHSVPRLASINGFGSMRESARICGVSPEWMRKGREELCKLLDLPIPEEGRKSNEVREKYSQNGKTNHWRFQKFKPNNPLAEAATKLNTPHIKCTATQQPRPATPKK